MREHPPLIVLGFDAGDPRWLSTWAAQGRLPTLASIMERGAWGTVTGPDLINEHSVWVSLLSGVPMSRHGFFYYRRLKPGTYELEMVTGRDAAARPFWCHAAGKRVAVIDAPHFFPDPDVAGIHLSEWATHHPYFPPSAHPQEVLEEARRAFGPQIRIPEKLESTLEDDRGIYELSLQRIERTGLLCRHLLRGIRFDATVIVFADSHLATHQFWEYRVDHAGQRKIDPNEVLERAIFEIYQRIDREMGAILAEAPEAANICIVSSTGMLDHFPTTGLFESFCRALGYQATPAGSGRVRPMAVLREILPERWRYAMSRWLSSGTQERLMNEKFRHGTDWERTTAFAIPSFFTSFLRVNLRGREPQGVVSPGEEYETLLDRLQVDLELLTDGSGAPLVKDVVRTAALEGGVPPRFLPDLFVEWSPHTRYLEKAHHPKAEIVAYPPEIWRSNDHSRSGFIALAGPTIHGLGSLGEVSILDIAPTFLALMGERVASEMVGSPLSICARPPNGS